VTSPGAFGKRKEEAYARATLDASLRVNNNPRPFYFLWLTHDEWPGVPLWHVEKEKGIAIASIVSCAGDWFGATGHDVADPDRFITADLQGGRLPAVLERELPCVLVGHWPCFYVNHEVGFKVLKEVKRRLDAYDPDGTKTLWMKNSEIGHYWMARELSDIAAERDARTGVTRVRIDTHFPTANFTVALEGGAQRVRVNGGDLRGVHSRRDFRSGTFLVEGGRSYAAFQLETGVTELVVS
jgi:hypothetical protein